jgi:hydroxyacylglutathione hydrolase
MGFSDEGASMSTLRILAIPAFNDNYFWLIHDGTHAAVVDPGEATPVLAALTEHCLTLTTILLTHHHADHVGGVAELTRRFDLMVWGPRKENIAGITQRLGEGDVVSLTAPAITLSVLDVPGHTLGHIAYVAREQPWLFCGDTLFAGGCGRLFEGSPEQMEHSLNKLAALPAETEVYCAHEYTMSNLRFARAVDADNLALQQRFDADQAKRDRLQPTVPSTIAMERATNPFLRSREPAIISALQTAGKLKEATGAASFAALRQWKNTFA